MSYRPKVLVLSAAMLLTACATQPIPQVAATEAATEAPAKVNSAYEKSCLRETGTRIRLPPGACNAMPGRVFTREDLDRTSAMGLGEAMFLLGAF